jgi:hypothetical protein
MTQEIALQKRARDIEFLLHSKQIYEITFCIVFTAMTARQFDQ